MRECRDFDCALLRGKSLLRLASRGHSRSGMELLMAFPIPLQTRRPYKPQYMTDSESDADAAAQPATPSSEEGSVRGNGRPVEIGGRGGLDPTRYGDWEKNGRCIDF